MVNQAFAESTVVLLHGLARSSGSMSRMEDALRKAGYSVCNIGYPSTKYSIEDLASKFVIPEIRKCVSTRRTPISFVTHSMGGIINRQIHKTTPEIRFGRVVMLGPPNHGSELVDHMRDWLLFQWINGPAGQQLGTEPESVPNRLGAATFEVGIIAGNDPFFEPFKDYISGPSDGKVSVASAKLEGMKDYLVLPVTHAFMMRNQQVIEQTINFLDTGHFAKDSRTVHKLSLKEVLGFLRQPNLRDINPAQPPASR